MIRCTDLKLSRGTGESELKTYDGLYEECSGAARTSAEPKFNVQQTPCPSTESDMPAGGRALHGTNSLPKDSYDCASNLLSAITSMVSVLSLRASGSWV